MQDNGKGMAEFKIPGNLKEFALFSYPINHLEKKDKVRFYYALKGRDGKSGIIKMYEIEQVARGALIVPISHKEDVASFLEGWGCKYEIRRVFLER